MVTSGQRASIEDLIMSILAGAQVSIDAAQKYLEEKGGAKGAISAAKKSILESAIIQGPKKTINQLSKISKAVAGTFGIQFSIASILKQSQIFTGVLGTIFQILGAFVDVTLAPFMPIFIRIIRRMVTWIPTIQEKAEQAAAWLEQAWFTYEGNVTLVLGAGIKAGIESVDWGRAIGSIMSNPQVLGAVTGVAVSPFVGPFGPVVSGAIGAAIGGGFAAAGADFQADAANRARSNQRMMTELGDAYHYQSRYNIMN